jgi:hypothetical protein
VVEYLILYVEKVARLTPWEHVSHIFWRTADGEIRKMMYYKELRHVADGTARFYVMHEGRQVELEIAHDALGSECLRATIDGEKIDVLLNLPDYRNGADLHLGVLQNRDRSPNWAHRIPLKADCTARQHTAR